MSEESFEQLFYFSLISEFLPLFFLIYKWKNNPINRLLLSHFLIACVTELFGIWFIYVLHMYNLIILNFYNIALIGILGLIYSYLLDKKFNKAIVVWIFSFVIIFLICLYNWSIYYSYYSLTYIWISIGAIILSVYYMFRFLLNAKDKTVLSDGYFLINFAIFFYFSLTFYLSLLESFIRYSDTLLIIWPIQFITTIISNGIFLYAIVRLKKEERKMDKEISQNYV